MQYPAIHTNILHAVYKIWKFRYEAPGFLIPWGFPSEFRNMTNCSTESFKQGLDTFLETIPDEPQTPGYTYMRASDERSRIDVTPLTTARYPSMSKEVPQARY